MKVGDRVKVLPATVSGFVRYGTVVALSQQPPAADVVLDGEAGIQWVPLFRLEAS